MSSTLDFQKNIFAHLFRTANKLQVFLDRELRQESLTGKQLFLMIVIASFGESSPSIRETADRGGSSYQNVKQLALRLERGGFLRIEQDPGDARIKRLRLTPQAVDFWDARKNEDLESLDLLFGGFTSDELKNLMDYLTRMESGIERMEGREK